MIPDERASVSLPLALFAESQVTLRLHEHPAQADALRKVCRRRSTFSGGVSQGKSPVPTQTFARSPERGKRGTGALSRGQRCQ